jgi:threonine aldolase
MNVIDLRSDTVTRPGKEMKAAMAAAEVGDDVYGEDPTVNRLEKLAAETMGYPAAIFCTSGTQSNLLALLTHCSRGDEYIVGQHAHTYKYEGGGGAVLGGIQPQPLDLQKDGTLDLDQVAAYIKPDDFHFARTRLLCLENTQAGNVLPLSYLKKARDLARFRNLSIHLDGARIFNAAVKLNTDVKTITQYFDTVSVCLSKGLGAPVGSVLCGSTEQIHRARRWRKMLGGGMRQAGFLAAAGIYALTHHIDRLAEDHENAAALAGGLSGIDGMIIDLERVQTNILFAGVDSDFNAFYSYLRDQNILIAHSNPFRLVTHLDVSSDDIAFVLETVRKFFTKK